MSKNQMIDTRHSSSLQVGNQGFLGIARLATLLPLFLRAKSHLTTYINQDSLTFYTSQKNTISLTNIYHSYLISQGMFDPNHQKTKSD